MSILQFTPYNLLHESDSDSDSDCDDDVMHKIEHQRRQLSVLKQHDVASYESWVHMINQYTNLSHQYSLTELHIENLTQQNELLLQSNAELVLENELLRTQHQENTRLVDKTLEQEDRIETFLGELKIIQEQLANGVRPDKVIYHIQTVLTQDAIKQYGYV